MRYGQSETAQGKLIKNLRSGSTYTYVKDQSAVNQTEGLNGWLHCKIRIVHIFLQFGHCMLLVQTNEM